MYNKVIAIDFDGTIVEHAYPDIGTPRPGAIRVMKALVENGVKLILYTMRSGVQLEEAIKYLKDNEIDLWGVNLNPDQANWTSSTKVYANLYIDDAALGAPLEYRLGYRPAIDWFEVEDYLKKNGYLK